MTALEVMLAGIVDYAGLFPPANLPMAPTVHNYAAFLGGPYAWMLGRLVVPAGRLAEFADALTAEFGDQPPHAPWRLSILGSSAEDRAGFETALQADIASWKALCARLPGLVEGGAWEIRLPTSALDAQSAEDGVLAFATLTHATLANELGPELRIALETPFAGDWARRIPEAINAIAHAQRAAAGRDVLLSAKIRTGSVDPRQVPTVEQVACFIAACAEAELPFKATAGLHHPVRHVDPALGVPVHGFLNVFGAAGFARLRGWDAARLREVLADDAPEHFDFEPQAFCWRSEQIEKEELRGVRQNFALSFGSCSFAEPIEDVQARGWMERRPMRGEDQW
jgi:hypothetical protein